MYVSIMSELISYRGTVYPWQCDHMGHMNVQWYVAKFDEATWPLLAQIGLTASRFRRDNSGMAAVEQRISYKRELHPGDTVTIRSSLRELSDKSIRVWHEMRHDETEVVAATAEIVGVHIDTVTRKARSLPDDVRRQAMALLDSKREDEVGALV